MEIQDPFFQMVGNLSLFLSHQPTVGGPLFWASSLLQHRAQLRTRGVWPWACPLRQWPVIQDRAKWGFNKYAHQCKGGTVRGDTFVRYHFDSSHLSLRLTSLGPCLSPQVIRLRLWLYGRVFWMIMDHQWELIIYALKAYSWRHGFNPIEDVSVKERMASLDRKRSKEQGSSSKTLHVGGFLHLLHFKAEEI